MAFVPLVFFRQRLINKWLVAGEDATGNPQKSQVYEKHSNSCKMNEGRLSALVFILSAVDF